MSQTLPIKSVYILEKKNLLGVWKVKVFFFYGWKFMTSLVAFLCFFYYNYINHILFYCKNIHQRKI